MSLPASTAIDARLASAWPADAFRVPLLAAIDERGRRELEAAGRLRRLEPNQLLFSPGDHADTLAVVVFGSILTERPAQDFVAIAVSGDVLGEESLLDGQRRRSQARATASALVVELPAAIVRRVIERNPSRLEARRWLRRLQRRAVRSVLAETLQARGLSAADVELLATSGRLMRMKRGVRLFSAGDVVTSIWLILHGLVQLQRSDADRVKIVAYAGAGGFCDPRIAIRERHGVSAVALGECDVWRVPVERFRDLVVRYPRLLPEQTSEPLALPETSSRTTRHVFKDVYRLEMASSLLAIDQDACVRCGHCASTCETLHGTSRLVRRGEIVVASIARGGDVSAPRNLLLPSSCQHCTHPVCMRECPTGAIERDRAGEVVIREDLCTGCGACEKACPWDNIQMAPRRETRAGLSDGVAIKCDLCREFAEPACVAACPTEAIARLEPRRDIAELAELFGSQRRRAAAPEKRARAGWREVSTPVAALASAALGLALHGVLELAPASALGLLAGIAAAIGCLSLGAHVLLKRWPALWLARRPAGVAAPGRVRRSRVAGWLAIHILVGAAVPALVSMHAGLAMRPNLDGLLMCCFWLVTILGVASAIAYRWLPPELARLERKALLPEDFPVEHEALLARLQREATGKSELVKRLLGALLLPYTRAKTASFALVMSSRELRAEERRLRSSVERILDGRGASKLDGLDALIRIAVELCALRARRSLELTLRALPELHALLALVLWVLLVLHVVAVMR